ncbi:hypothetical protein Tco_1253918 [Tanacetum coccineum]
METKAPLAQDEGGPDVDLHLYRSMIGCLMYLTASRPDIMYAVCACSRFQVTPKVSHLYAVKRIFKYIKGKPKLGLWYPRESPLDLVAYSDSDYAAANLDRKSTTGGCQFLGRRLISWQCKKQTIVATSTTEAEYVAAASCCGQVLWLQNQLLDYGFNFMNTIIHIDNQSTICIIKNPVYHSKTKHIEIRHHFIRDCYEKKLIQVQKIHTDLNVADLLTKPFDGPRFNPGSSVKVRFNPGSSKLKLILVLLGVEKGDARSTWTWKRKCQLSLANWMQFGCSKLRYALTHNPPIYDSLVKQFWQTATARTLADGTQQLNATIDSIEYTITEESVRRQLQLADDSGITMLQNEEIFEGLQNIGPSPTSPPPPPPETEPTTDEYLYEEHSPVHHHFSPSQEQAPSRMPMDDLLHTVPKLISRIDSLELDLKQTKLTMGNAIVKLVKKVKKLEGFLKRRNLVLTDSEDEEPEAQGRKDDADPQRSSIQGLVASLKSRSIDKGRRYKRRKETKGKKVVSSLDFQEDDAGAEKINTAGEINAAGEEVNTASKVNTGSIELNTVIEQDSTAGENKGQREGKAPMLSEETPKKSKEQILQEEASLAEASSQVQFEAQYYTNEDWDLIRAKLEANAELSKSMLGSELQGEDFAKRMVDIVNQRKKLFAEERAKAKRNKPMTQSQLKTYMMNYLKNQGTWKINQLKKLSFEEVKEELQTKTPKRLKEDKVDESKEDDHQRIRKEKKAKWQGKRKYPLSAEVCKTMLKMKLLDGKMNEDCYRLLKMMEKQAGIRNSPCPGPNIRTASPGETILVKTYQIRSMLTTAISCMVFNHHIPATAPTSTNPVNTGSDNLNTGFEEVNKEDNTEAWLLQSKRLAGKELSNPLIADDLLKIIWLSMYHGLTNLNID